MLLMFIGIGVSGLMMTFVSPTDIVGVKAFFRGLMTFNWQPLPTDTPILLHLGLVALFMIIFPFSKLVHAPGVFFSPTRNQVDNPREKRHVAPWALELEQREAAEAAKAGE
jgi:nitrate reductase gamma subunit